VNCQGLLYLVIWQKADLSGMLLADFRFSKDEKNSVGKEAGSSETASATLGDV
jgi:hypothetical protein